VSTTIKNIPPQYSPANSTLICCHGLDGHVYRWSGATAGAFLAA